VGRFRLVTDGVPGPGSKEDMGRDGPGEVVQSVAVRSAGAGTVRWPGPISDGAPGSGQRRQACWDRSVKGFQPVMFAAVQGKWETPERKERSHHWIARSGCAVVPRGYRSPIIGLEGGSRLRVSDPRSVRLSGGRRGHRNPASRSVDNGETQPWDPGCRTAPGVSCDVEVE
jgi:hypothetical protein